MNLKALTLALFLFSSQHDLQLSANNQDRPSTGIEQVVKRHLEQLLSDLDIDENSQSFHKKYKLKVEYDSETRKDIRVLANKLGLQEEWLYHLFALESRGNPQAVNKVSNATGLIQFMPSTAKSLGTSIDDLVKMTTSEQLVYVEKYIVKVQRGRTFTQFLDLYLAVFYPHAIGRPLSYEVGSERSTARASSIYEQNKNIDAVHGNDDGILTKEDILAWVS